MKNFQMAWRGTCLALFLMLVHAAPTGAQTTLGRVAGTVLDSSGAVLPGATITMTSEQTNQVQTAVSGATGAFLFPQVPVGTYKVEIALQGFKSATFTKVSVAVAQEYALTARLELGNVSENVTVEAGVSLVPTTSPEVSTTVGQQQIVSLPLNGRNPISLVQLQAGVASLGRTSTAINGGRPTWTQVTQDGDQHPGQLHPHQLGRLRAEPADRRTTSASSRLSRRLRAPTTRAGRPKCG